MANIARRKCTTCGKNKLVRMYHKQGDGLCPSCANCKNMYSLRYRAKAKEYKQNQIDAHFDKYKCDIVKLRSWTLYWHNKKWTELSDIMKKYYAKEYRKYLKNKVNKKAKMDKKKKANDMKLLDKKLHQVANRKNKNKK